MVTRRVARELRLDDAGKMIDILDGIFDLLNHRTRSLMDLRRLAVYALRWWPDAADGYRESTWGIAPSPSSNHLIVIDAVVARKSATRSTSLCDVVLSSRVSMALISDHSPFSDAIVVIAQHWMQIDKLSAQNHYLFGTGSGTRDALIFIHADRMGVEGAPRAVYTAGRGCAPEKVAGELVRKKKRRM